MSGHNRQAIEAVAGCPLFFAAGRFADPGLACYGGENTPKADVEAARQARLVAGKACGRGRRDGVVAWTNGVRLEEPQP